MWPMLRHLSFQDRTEDASGDDAQEGQEGGVQSVQVEFGRR